MSKKLNGLLVILGGLFVSGCNSGSQSSSQPTQNPNDIAIQGVISYNRLDQMADTTLINPTVNTNNTQNISIQNGSSQTFTFNNAACTPLMTKSTTWHGVAGTLDTFVFAGLGDFIPEFSNVARFSNSMITTAVSLYYKYDDIGQSSPTGNCITSLENQIAGQLNYMENQITQMQFNIAQLQNDFYDENYKTSLSIAGLYGQNLQSAYQFIYGATNESGQIVSNGLFQEFMNASGLWVDGVPQESATIQALATQVFPRIDIGILSVAGAEDFQKAVQNISGTSLNIQCTDNCFNQVTQNNDSALIQTYSNLYQAYLNAMNAIDESNKNVPTLGGEYTNSVDIINNYNNAIVAIYLQSVMSLQQAYTMEWAINKFNFVSYNINSFPQLSISSLGQVANTHYDYNQVNMNNVSLTPSQIVTNNVNAYNQAQTQLMKLYAARFNALYLNTISYMVTDKPSVIQEPLVESNSTYYVNYQGSQNVFTQYTLSSVEAAKMNNAFISNLAKNTQAPLDRLPGSGYKSNAILYQFGGLSSFSECSGALDSFNLNPTAYQNNIMNSLTNSTCPLLYTDNNGNVVDNSLYYASNQANVYVYGTDGFNQPTLAQQVTNNIAACNIGSTLGSLTGDLYFWLPTSAVSPTGTNGAAYLSCNYWVNKPTTNTSGTGVIATNVQTTVGARCNGSVFNTMFNPSAASYLSSEGYSTSSCGDEWANYGGYDWGYGVDMWFQSYGNAQMMPVNSTNNSLFTIQSQSSSELTYGNGYTNQVQSSEISAVYEFNNNSVTGNEEYLALQMNLTNMDNLIVPLNLAVANLEYFPGNQGALTCSFEPVTSQVQFQGNNEYWASLCSNQVNTVNQLKNQSVVNAGLSDSQQVFGVQFLGNASSSAYITNGGTYIWNIYYGVYNVSDATGTAW